MVPPLRRPRERGRDGRRASVPAGGGGGGLFLTFGLRVRGR
jgi:hypothetical protein